MTLNLRAEDVRALQKMSEELGFPWTYLAREKLHLALVQKPKVTA